MANKLINVFKKPVACNLLSRLQNVGLASIYNQDVKNLYSRAALGLDGFTEQSKRVRTQLTNIADKFREKMSDYVKSESQQMIFTEDLKNMVHLAESDTDIELTIEMLKRYNKQNKNLRFGNFIFGPVIMRMFFIHNKPELAAECFKNEELTGLFDQQITYQILLDLLLENQKYKELLEISELISDKQLEGQRYPRNVVVLTLAACYKMNSQESLDYALNYWTKLSEFGHQPMRRAATFCAALALNHSKADIALEILSMLRNQSYTTVRNLRVAALADLGRIEDIVPILKGVLNEDNVRDETHLHTFNAEILEKVKSKLNNDDIDLVLNINRLEEMLKKQGHVTDEPLDKQLCSEIQRPSTFFRQGENQFDPRYGRNSNDFNRNRGERRDFKRFEPRPRPGLSELV